MLDDLPKMSGEWEKIKDKIHNPPKKDFLTCTKITARSIVYRHRNHPYVFRIDQTPEGILVLTCTHNKNFFDACITKGIDSFGLANLNLNTYAVYHKRGDKEIAKNFLETLDKFTPLGELKNDLLIHMGIKASEEDVAKEVSHLVEQGKFTPAIQLAKKVQLEGYYDVIWALVQRLHQDELVNHSTLIDIFQSISPQNPHYKEANLDLIALYTPDAFPDHKDEPFFYLEKQFEAAMRSGDNPLIEQTLHTICANKGMKFRDKDHTLNEIFINLAREMRELKITNQNLLAEKNQLTANKNNEPPHEPYKARLW